jgi:serine/threonine protein kinase/Tol biopolymer transport system component
MPLSVGDKLGHYEILSLLGQGGMGEVYRARDSTLKRDVALKVLPATFLGDPDRMARFQREAEVLASLEHPNIGHIHGIVDSEDSRGLVLALIEGPTLADRIEAGPIPVDEAIAISKQIVDALEYAHDRGVVHRDLKPANVKITPDGVVKVLDFGLAKVLEDELPPSSVTKSPTLTLGHTRAGMILGTVAYMSPEQAVGRPVDRRSDIFSFGAVLYEMLTGKRAFSGESTPDLLEAVVKDDPDWAALPAAAPDYLRRLLKRTLVKDRKQRLQAAGEARIILANPEQDAGPSEGSRASSSKWSILAWAMAVLLAIVAASLAFIHFREKPPVAELLRFQISGPEKVTLAGLRLSPDGRRLAFVGRMQDGRSLIWLRSLDQLEAHPLSGTEGGASPFWSPDSRFIAFAANTKLKKVEASGGPVQIICDLRAAMGGGAWAPDGTIVFGAASQLMRIAETGGVPVPLTPPSRESLAYPSFLPDWRHFLYVRGSAAQDAIYIGSLDAKPEQNNKPLVTVPFPNFPVYASSPDPGIGYVLFARDNSLMALPFDVRRLEPAGVALPIAEGIGSGSSFSASSSLSSAGILAFRSGGSGNDSQLLWFDREGKQIGQMGPTAPYGNVRLSPDGKRLLVDHRAIAPDGFGFDHLWIADIGRGVFSRVNPGDAMDYGGVFSPDGRAAFTYYGGEGVSGDIYVRLASGAGAAEPVVKSATVKHPNDWSLDGMYLMYDEHSLRQRQDLWIVPMSEKAEHKPIPFLATPADETDGAFSPDTKWIAYSSDESGRREVYVQGFVPDHVPAAGVGKWQISSAGGAKPRWRRDGKELYYIASNGKMMAVPVKSTSTTFEPGVAVPLFDTQTVGFVPYDVASDGRFLINTPMESASASSIIVVLNWTVGLKK